MSNHHAGRVDDASFCSTIAAYTRMAVTSSDRDFILLAQSVVEPPVSTCGTGAHVAAVVPPPLPPALRRPEPVAAPIYAPAAVEVDDPYAPGREVIGAPVAVAPPYETGPVVPYAEPVAYPESAPAAEPVYSDARVDAGIVVDPEVIAPPARATAFAEPRPELPPEPSVGADAGYPAPPPIIHPVARAVPATVAPARAIGSRTALPTKVIAAAPVVPPGETKEVQSPAAALQAAIAALQAATDALKAQQIAAAGPTN